MRKQMNNPKKAKPNKIINQLWNLFLNKLVLRGRHFSREPLRIKVWVNRQIKLINQHNLNIWKNKIKINWSRESRKKLTIRLTKSLRQRRSEPRSLRQRRSEPKSLRQRLAVRSPLQMTTL